MSQKAFEQGHALVVGVGGDLKCTVTDAIGLAYILKDESRCAWAAQTIKPRDKRMDVGFRCVKPIFSKEDIPRGEVNLIGCSLVSATNAQAVCGKYGKHGEFQFYLHGLTLDRAQ